LKLTFDVGDLCPIHATALGKVVGAYLERDEMEALLPKGKLPKYTERTLTTRGQLKTELLRVRQLGYATNVEETVEGAILGGAPLFDSDGKIFAAISVSCPSVRCSPTKRKEMIQEMLIASSAITSDLRDAAFKAPRVR
jgi:DNA-binding IclR family transcriptional regulator